MAIKELFDDYFNELDKKLIELNKKCDKQTEIVINNFYSNTLDQVEDAMNKRETRELKEELNISLIKFLETITSTITNQTYKTIKKLLKSTRDISMFSTSFPIFDSKTSSNIINDYKTEIKNINTFNKDYISKIDDTFDLFLYRISISYELKNNVSLYNLIKNSVKQNKKILVDNIKSINDDFKDESISLFENYFNSFIKESLELKENVINKNDIVIKEYSKEKLQNYAFITSNKTLKTNCQKIDNLLKDMHNRIKELQKSKPTKDKQIELSILNNYLVSFNNTLFDKSLNTLVKMTSIVEYNKKDADKTIEKYNDIIYKICDFEYSFEKQFMRYKKAILNKKYFVSNRITDYISKLIIEKEKEVVNIVKLSVIDLFKDNVNELNTMVYKTVMINYQLKDNFKILDTKEVKKYFEKKQD